MDKFQKKLNFDFKTEQIIDFIGKNKGTIYMIKDK